jgi:hypothetical protein
LRSIYFLADSFTVELSDSRTLCVPYTVSPKSLTATPEQREAERIGASGFHWDLLDEDLGIKGLLRADFAQELQAIRDTMPMTQPVRRD